MKFVLVKTTMDAARFGVPQWRATCAEIDKATDIFFYACNEADAKQHVRLRYPVAVFSDEEPFS
jgi:hypothetical protein